MKKGYCIVFNNKKQVSVLRNEYFYDTLCHALKHALNNNKENFRVFQVLACDNNIDYFSDLYCWILIKSEKAKELSEENIKGLLKHELESGGEYMHKAYHQVFVEYGII